MRGTSFVSLMRSNETAVYHSYVSGEAERDRRRRQAVALRGEGTAVRAIAAALGISHPTVLRDLRIHDQAEAELVLAALAGEPQHPEKLPPQLSTEQQHDARRSKDYRWHYAAELRRRGASLRAIARQVGASPATVLRDLQRDPDWASDQADRADLRETRERLRERRASHA
jgi:IS30 family transposase